MDGEATRCIVKLGRAGEPCLNRDKTSSSHLSVMRESTVRFGLRLQNEFKGYAPVVSQCRLESSHFLSLASEPYRHLISRTSVAASSVLCPC